MRTRIICADVRPQANTTGWYTKLLGERGGRQVDGKMEGGVWPYSITNLRGLAMSIGHKAKQRTKQARAPKLQPKKISIRSQRLTNSTRSRFMVSHTEHAIPGAFVISTRAQTVTVGARVATYAQASLPPLHGESVPVKGRQHPLSSAIVRSRDRQTG